MTGALKMTAVSREMLELLTSVFRGRLVLNKAQAKLHFVFAFPVLAYRRSRRPGPKKTGVLLLQREAVK